MNFSADLAEVQPLRSHSPIVELSDRPIGILSEYPLQLAVGQKESVALVIDVVPSLGFAVKATPTDGTTALLIESEPRIVCPSIDLATRVLSSIALGFELF